MYTNPLKGADQLTISVHSSSQHLNPPQHAYLNKRNMFFSVTLETPTLYLSYLQPADSQLRLVDSGHLK